MCEQIDCTVSHQADSFSRHVAFHLPYWIFYVILLFVSIMRGHAVNKNLGIEIG